MTVGDAYAGAGVDRFAAEVAVKALIGPLSHIELGHDPRSVVQSGHYASVLRLTDDLGLALSTDGVGSKLVLATELSDYRGIGIDCVAMNVNDVISVGAAPVALLDYIAVERPNPDVLQAIGESLREAATECDIEIPGGELAVLPELINGGPSRDGFDLLGFCVGVVSLDRLILGRSIRPGDSIIGIPANGVHANGLTLARAVLDDVAETPPELGGASVGQVLLTPTVLYVRAVRDLLDTPIEVGGLAHITSDGLLNLLRFEATDTGYRIDQPLTKPPIFDLIASRGTVEDTEMYDVFNMGCGFCCVVPPEAAESAIEIVSARHPGTAIVGEVTDRAGFVELPFAGIEGTRERRFYYA